MEVSGQHPHEGGHDDVESGLDDEVSSRLDYPQGKRGGGHLHVDFKLRVAAQSLSPLMVHPCSAVKCYENVREYVKISQYL